MPDDGGGSVKRVYERLTKHHSQKQDYDVRNSCSSSDSLSDHVANQKDNLRITKVDPSMVRPATKLVKNNDNNGVLFLQGNPFWMWKTRAERLAANKTDETDFTIPSAPQILKDLQDKHNNLPDAPLPLPRFNPWQDAIKMAKRDKTYFSKDNISNNIAYCLLLMDEKVSNREERTTQKLPFTEPNAFIEYKRDDLNQNKSVDWKPSGKGVCRKEKKKKGTPAPLPVAVLVEVPKKRWRGFGLRVRGFAFRDKNSKKENKKSEREADAAPGEVNVTPTSSSTRIRKQKEAKPPSPPKFIEPIEILRQSRAKQEEREHDNSSDPFFDPPASAQDTQVMKTPQKSREEKSAEVSKSSESSAEADKRRKSADRSREKSKEADKSAEKPPAKVESQTRVDAQKDKEDSKKPHNKESKKSNISARSKKKKKPKKKVHKKKKRLRDTLTEESMKTSKKLNDETKSDDGRKKESTKKKSTVKTSDED